MQSQSKLTDDDKAKIFQYLYRNTGLSLDQTWRVIQQDGYESAFEQIRKYYRLDKTFEDFT